MIDDMAVYIANLGKYNELDFSSSPAVKLL